MRAVRLLRINAKRLFADGGADTAPQLVSVVVFDLTERPLVDDRVLLIPACALFALPS